MIDPRPLSPGPRRGTADRRLAFPSHRPPRPPAGLTLTEVLATFAALLILLAVCLPAIARGRGVNDASVSLANLAAHNFGHVVYASDWNGRQYTPLPDALSSYGSTIVNAMSNYVQQNGSPVLALGWGPTNPDAKGPIGLWGFYVDSSPGNAVIYAPIDFEIAFGRFRIPNAQPLHDYIDGRFYSATHFAPGDAVPLLVAEPAFDEPFPYTPSSFLSGFGWSSYCLSSAALYGPDVFRAPSEGGWQDPFDLPDGFATPPLAAAAHAHLKTLVMEHNWVRGAASPCNPKMPAGGVYETCEPWQFNHAIDAVPAALFHDGHARLLPNAEVQASDQMVLSSSGGIDGLWSRDTPFGPGGYRNGLAFDPMVNVSHHVLTTGGIMGRDTLGPMMTGLAAPPLEPRPPGFLHTLLPSPVVPLDLEESPWVP